MNTQSTDSNAAPRPKIHVYLNLSLLFLALRELWLQRQTKEGAPVEATVETAYHTDPVNKRVFRAELRYSYQFGGRELTGRVARDYFLNHKAADKLAQFRRGEKLVVRVRPDRPEVSYYPSGFGFVEPIVLAPVLLFIAAFVLIVPIALLWAYLYQFVHN